jgi:LmbE family N-acetylglucosaminyl deacetylase
MSPPALRFRRVVVVSPHLDDGVFSLGAAVSHSTRRGAEVTMLTVLAGDPESPLPAGDWDQWGGFTTAGEAAHARRQEDARACALIGARPVWLPFSDEQYDRGADDATIWAAICDAVRGADAVLVPASPLKHADHRWLRRLVDERGFPGVTLGHYREQPYAGLLPNYRGAELPASARRLAASPRDWLAKARACRAYVSQVPLFGRAPVARMLAYELRQRGERVAWLG